MSEHKPNLVVILMSVIFLVLTLLGCSTVIGKRGTEQKVALLHFGPIEDYGWTYEAHLGAQAMAEALPYVELSEREKVFGPNSPQILREYADAEYKVIFCHGWDLGIEEVAPNYPDVIFMWGGGDEKKAPNTGIHR